MAAHPPHLSAVCTTLAGTQFNLLLNHSSIHLLALITPTHTCIQTLMASVCAFLSIAMSMSLVCLSVYLSVCLSIQILLSDKDEQVLIVSCAHWGQNLLCILTVAAD